MKTLSTLVTFVTLFLCLPPITHAATNTWDGGGADNLWSNATNWVGDVAPVAGNDLQFPENAAQLSNVNDFPSGTGFHSLTFTRTNSGVAYNVSGNSIVLSAGLATIGAGVHTFSPTITLAAPQAISVDTGGTLTPGVIDNGGNDLTISGAGVANFSSTISGAGGLIKTGSGNLSLRVANSYLGVTTILQGSVTLRNGFSLGATNGGTILTNDAVIQVFTGIAVAEPLTISGGAATASLVNISGTNSWDGPIFLAGSSSSAQIALSSGLFVINGLISGSGFTKSGLGPLALNANNTYTGETHVSGGTVLVNGSQPLSPVTLDNASTVVLGGTGVVGTVTASGGTMNPGASPGILSTSNLVFNASTTNKFELNGTTPGSGYDQLNVTGSVTLGGSVLNVVLGYTPAIGDSFTIINNDGSDAITNQFNGLANNTIFAVSGLPFQISYAGGGGNDVVLTRVRPASVVSNAANAGPNFHFQVSGIANVNYVIEASTNLANWLPISTNDSGPTGVFTFIDSGTSQFTNRFFRVATP